MIRPLDRRTPFVSLYCPPCTSAEASRCEPPDSGLGWLYSDETGGDSVATLDKVANDKSYLNSVLPPAVDSCMTSLICAVDLSSKSVVTFRCVDKQRKTF